MLHLHANLCTLDEIPAACASRALETKITLSVVAAAAGKFADDRADEALGVAEEHQGLVEVVERVVDSGEARAMLRLMTMTVRALSTSRIGMP